MVWWEAWGSGSLAGPYPKIRPVSRFWSVTNNVCVLDAGFYFLFKNYEGGAKSSFSTFGDTVMMLFSMTLGEYEVGLLSFTCVTSLVLCYL